MSKIHMQNLFFWITLNSTKPETVLQALQHLRTWQSLHDDPPDANAAMCFYKHKGIFKYKFVFKLFTNLSSMLNW